MINDIRVFEGTFSAVVLEDHIFRMQKKQLDKQAKESKRNSFQSKWFRLEPKISIYICNNLEINN